MEIGMATLQPILAFLCCTAKFTVLYSAPSQYLFLQSDIGAPLLNHNRQRPLQRKSDTSMRDKFPLPLEAMNRLVASIISTPEVLT